MEARPPHMRRTLSPRLAYALAGAVIGLALFASITPSPLYGIYSQLWGFSPVVLTLIYGTYAFGVLATLILAGRISDEVGRRPVLLVALGTLLVTTILYMLAQSVAWLFVARGLQGLATGLALGAASAALLDLHPRRDPPRVRPTHRATRPAPPPASASPTASSARGAWDSASCWLRRSSSSRPRRGCCPTSRLRCC